MSEFDPTTYGVYRPKVIDLDKYSVDSNNNSISAYLQSLFLNSGGTETVETDGGLFADLRTNKTINVEFTALAVRAKTTNVTTIMENGILAYIGFACTILFGSDVVQASVIIRQVDNGAMEIIVKLE